MKLTFRCYTSNIFRAIKVLYYVQKLIYKAQNSKVTKNGYRFKIGKS